MKPIAYFILLLGMSAGFSSCSVHKAGGISAHYKTRPYNSYFMYSAGYGYVHPRPPID
jgi:hypothetical protein